MFQNDHVTTSSTISWTRIAHLQEFLVNLLAIDCCFFSQFTYFLHLLYLGKLSKPKYQKQNHERFAETCDSDKNNLYLSKQYGAGRLLSELPDKGRKLRSIDSLLKRICKTGTIVWLPGSGRPSSSRSSGRLVLSQEDKPKRHRSAREISHETAILCYSVHMIIHRDLQLKCFKRPRVQLLSEANRIFYILIFIDHSW